MSFSCRPIEWLWAVVNKFRLTRLQCKGPHNGGRYRDRSLVARACRMNFYTRRAEFTSTERNGHLTLSYRLYIVSQQWFDDAAAIRDNCRTKGRKHLLLGGGRSRGLGRGRVRLHRRPIRLSPIPADRDHLADARCLRVLRIHDERLTRRANEGFSSKLFAYHFSRFHRRLSIVGRFHRTRQSRIGFVEG